nr:MAG TPA: hypothetical protein [Caudoviricetes sp.]
MLENGVISESWHPHWKQITDQKIFTVLLYHGNFEGTTENPSKILKSHFSLNSYIEKEPLPNIFTMQKLFFRI